MSLALVDHVRFKGRLKEDGKFSGRNSIAEIITGLRQNKEKKVVFSIKKGGLGDYVNIFRIFRKRHLHEYNFNYAQNKLEKWISR